MFPGKAHILHTISMQLTGLLKQSHIPYNCPLERGQGPIIPTTRYKHTSLIHTPRIHAPTELSISRAHCYMYIYTYKEEANLLHPPWAPGIQSPCAGSPSLHPHHTTGTAPPSGRLPGQHPPGPHWWHSLTWTSVTSPHTPGLGAGRHQLGDNESLSEYGDERRWTFSEVTCRRHMYGVQNDFIVMPDSFSGRSNTKSGAILSNNAQHASLHVTLATCNDRTLRRLIYVHVFAL